MSLRLVTLGLLMVLLGSKGHATPTIGSPVTWDVGGGSLGWVNLGAVAQSVNSVDSGDPSRGGYLQILFNVGDPPNNSQQSDRVENSDLGYQGDYSGLIVSFDYLGYNNSSRNLYFISDNGHMWTYDIPNTTTSWEHLSISFNDPFQWSSDEGTFVVDRAHVVSLGFYLQTPGSAIGFVPFGIDNLEFNKFTTQVPEPDAMLMLMTAVLCLLVTFRVERFMIRPEWMKRKNDRT